MKEIHFDTIDSTNSYAKTHSKEFSQSEITCIHAEEQTQGKGRFERSWFSPKGVNIYATFYFTLPKKSPDLGALGQLMALSLSYILEKKGLFPKVKWPNDVRLNNKKIAGVLTETIFYQETVACFVGIGVNVNLSSDLLKKIDQPATSLKIETGRSWEKLALLKELQEQFANDLLTFKKKGFSPFSKALDSLLSMKGEKVRCFDGKTTWEGICHSVTENGQLNLMLQDGTLHTVLSGDLS